MPPGSSPGRARRFLKRITKVFKPGGQTPTSRTASPPPVAQPSASFSQPATPSREPVLIASPQLPAQSQQLDALPQPEPTPAEPAPTSSPSVTAGDPPANAESTLTLAKKAGEAAWSGLKVTLRSLEKSSDVFPPLKAAVGGFLGVVDIFEVCGLTSHGLV